MTKQRPWAADLITAVYVSKGDGLHYTCQWRDEAGGFTCGRCGHGALGLKPAEGDACKVCGCTVSGVRRGPPEPSWAREDWQ